MIGLKQIPPDERQPDTPTQIQPGLKVILADMSFWLKKSNSGFSPPEDRDRCLDWIQIALHDLALGKMPRWPAGCPWDFDPSLVMDRVPPKPGDPVIPWVQT